MKFRLEYRWIDGSSWFLPALLFFWSLWVGYVGYVNFNLGAVDIPIICIFFIFGASYGGVAILLNRTILTVTPEQLEIQHEPVPWFGEKSIAVASIESFSCIKKHRRGTTFFSIYCNMPDKKRTSIFLGVHIVKPEEAMNVILKIKNWLEPYRKVSVIDTRDSR